MQNSTHIFTLAHGPLSLVLALEIEYEREHLYAISMKQITTKQEGMEQYSEIFESSNNPSNSQNSKISKNFKNPKNLMDNRELEQKIIKDSFAKKVFTQLGEYFMGQRTSFDIPLKPVGTPFQLRVWQALTQIPYGQTCSYKDIACSIDNEKACRAVGMANNKNPISIIVPCHRVIGASGKLVGYASGLTIKSALLDLEKYVALSSIK